MCRKTVFFFFFFTEHTFLGFHSITQIQQGIIQFPYTLNQETRLYRKIRNVDPLPQWNSAGSNNLKKIKIKGWWLNNPFRPIGCKTSKLHKKYTWGWKIIVDGAKVKVSRKKQGEGRKK